MPDQAIAMFEHANGNMVQGNVFNIQQRKSSETDRHSMNLLEERCCIGAQVDSNERFDPPRCDLDTRVKITQDIMDWIKGDDEEASIMVLHGSAGAGKSALEQTIAQLCQQEGRLASSFFLSRTAANPQRSNGDVVIPTLVYQHLQVFPWIKNPVLDEIEAYPKIFDLSREVQFDRLFVKHFQGPRQQLSGYTQPRLIAIDGLDECNDRNVQLDLLRIIAAAVPHLQHPFRFFIACRPETHIMQVIHRDPLFQNAFIHRIDLNEDTQVDNDIRHFLTKKFRKIRESHPIGGFLSSSWPSADVIDTLVANSSGQFVYVDTVIRFIAWNNARPDDQLNIILSLTLPRQNEKPFYTLDSLYSHIFSCVQDRDTVQRILGIIWLASRHEVYGYERWSDEYHLSDPTNLERILNRRPG
ncbi:unnamed protein product [Cyclocybe aegerita]|uniref:Nephrocystin 3-like N-terminal domain-containing protein n=1 Tax=Cyclocybe aegerita TaxID=1973307 RepID=A0A8S0WHL5_CYCAE|nr:unnamed protein product [Cyclocybe aegerita]